MSTRMTRKGQVTIPKQVRDRLKLKPGTTVDFRLATDGSVTLAKVGAKRVSGNSAFAKIRGAAAGRMTTDRIMALTRGEA